MKLIYFLIQLSLAYKLTTSAKTYEIDGYKYYFSYPLKHNWYAAQRFCAYLNMSLIDIPNEGENTRILEVLTKNFGDQNTDGIYIWTSGTHLGTKGQYFWQTTGKPVFYESWLPGEPNNVDDIEDCLSLHGNHKFLWTDVNCLIEGYFICRDINNVLGVTEKFTKPTVQVESSEEDELRNLELFYRLFKGIIIKSFVQLGLNDEVEDNFDESTEDSIQLDSGDEVKKSRNEVEIVKLFEARTTNPFVFQLDSSKKIDSRNQVLIDRLYRTIIIELNDQLAFSDEFYFNTQRSTEEDEINRVYEELATQPIVLVDLINEVNSEIVRIFKEMKASDHRDLSFDSSEEDESKNQELIDQIFKKIRIKPFVQLDLNSEVKYEIDQSTEDNIQLDTDDEVNKSRVEVEMRTNLFEAITTNPSEEDELRNLELSFYRLFKGILKSFDLLDLNDEVEDNFDESFDLLDLNDKVEDNFDESTEDSIQLDSGDEVKKSRNEVEIVKLFEATTTYPFVFQLDSSKKIDSRNRVLIDRLYKAIIRKLNDQLYLSEGDNSDTQRSTEDVSKEVESRYRDQIDRVYERNELATQPILLKDLINVLNSEIDRMFKKMKARDQT